jgi:hypothetical protein
MGKNYFQSLKLVGQITITKNIGTEKGREIKETIEI